MAVECTVLSASGTSQALSAEDNGHYSALTTDRGLITFAKPVQNAAHEWNRAENRNFQAFW
jgi:hypothetical protein